MAIFKFKKKGPLDQSTLPKPDAVPPVLVPLPKLILKTPIASVLVLCSSINTFVPVAVDWIILDTT